MLKRLVSKGPLLIIISSIAFAGMNYFYKYHAGEASRGCLLISRGLIGMILAAFFCQIKKIPLWPVHPYIITRSFFSGLALWSLFANFQYTTMAYASFFQSLSFLPVAMITQGKDLFTTKLITSVVFILLGLCLWADLTSAYLPPQAIFIGLLTCALSSGAVISLKKASHVSHVMPLIFYFSLTSLVLGIFIDLFSAHQSYNQLSWRPILMAGILAFVGQTLFSIGAKLSQTYLIIPLGFSLVFFSAILEMTFHGIHYSLFQYSGLSLILVGIFLIQQK